MRFEIMEVLKGAQVFALSLPGNVADRPDFNDRQVPYGTGRSSGRGGGCFAFSYQLGGEDPLLLKNRGGKFTPVTRAALGATNEQLGPDDRCGSPGFVTNWAHQVKAGASTAPPPSVECRPPLLFGR